MNTNRPLPDELLKDERMEVIISRLLRIGLIFASVIVLIGGMSYLIQHGTAVPHYSAFKGEPNELTTPHGVFAAALNHESRGIIQLGLLFLILTPIARVVFSALTFLIRRDYLYTGVTLFVLAVLIFNLLKT